MSWKHVVTVLIVTAGVFFTAWQAPLALVMLIGAGGYFALHNPGER